MKRALRDGQDGVQCGWVLERLSRQREQQAQRQGSLVGHTAPSSLQTRSSSRQGQSELGIEGLASGVRQSEAGACLKGAGNEAPRTSEVRKGRRKGWGLGCLHRQGPRSRERCNPRSVSQPVEGEGGQSQSGWGPWLWNPQLT